jgi:hypothetical protein
VHPIELIDEILLLFFPRILRYVMKIAMLGGYLARNNDPPPGNLVIWRGLNRLADIALGISMKEKLVGN